LLGGFAGSGISLSRARGSGGAPFDPRVENSGIHLPKRSELALHTVRRRHGRARNASGRLFSGNATYRELAPPSARSEPVGSLLWLEQRSASLLVWSSRQSLTCRWIWLITGHEKLPRRMRRSLTRLTQTRWSPGSIFPGEDSRTHPDRFGHFPQTPLIVH